MNTGKKLRKFVRAAFFSQFVLICMLLSGCWDEVNLQDVSYLTAVGIDYNDGKFTMYAQMLSFAAIAKSETPQTPSDPVWIGKGQGDSVMQAFFNLNRVGYATLSLEHLKTIVVHERAMNHIGELLDGLNRQRASRYTTLLYGTSIPLEKLFSTDYFFNLSPLSSLLYTPEPHDVQYTFINPLKTQSVVQQMKDPGMTVLVPAINATKGVWIHEKKPINTQIISGIHVFKNGTYQGYADEQDVRGIRWMNESFDKVYLEIEKDSSKATIAIDDSSPKPRAELANGSEKFTLNLKLKGHIVELDGKLTKQDISERIEQKVKTEMEATYKYGIGRKMDLFRLEHVLYRYHNGYWKEHAAKGDWQLRPDTLTVKVKLILKDSGKFDMSSGT